MRLTSVGRRTSGYDSRWMTAGDRCVDALLRAWRSGRSTVAGSSAVNHIVVVCLMGSGKTTIGRAVAQALGRPSSDSDLEIERATGRTVGELALERGIAPMHELEARHLLGADTATEPSV